MFYSELEKYTAALRAGTTKHDASFADVVSAVSGIPGLEVDVHYDNVRADTMLANLTFKNEYGSIELRYRYNTHYFLTLMCYVKHDGHTYPVRWWDDKSKFKYALAEHSQTVHDFMRAVGNGF
ncbi:hypothetical protein BIZ83_gp180 [Erwinia phage vB_EamM_ChrisDB]|jgi:hypothetical protein|uniref:hypothetical protein n=1 Tax=Erwinia phage vB_EamM_ChrisDB TaxID=1883371 RepID=UPI00081D15EE|nr:hypothetical protein BIZ83_gp180 [Erwinia phage vB_EamM_ChrisDB]ANZ48673.1 hypothetical protein CHRISDB_111 [Erwinia phage vB_EamM_ChrisDB]